MSSAHELIAPRPRAPVVPVPSIAVRHRGAIAVVVLAALTLLVPSAPTYDPWAWIIWGREIVHFDLSTVDGPSWKPLPVLLTTPFALFGGLAPDLWLVVARAGAIAGVVFAFRVARRLGGMPAGAAAAAAYALAPWTIRNAGFGNSEGMLVALALAGVDRHLAGRPRQAFVLALGAALLRPEAWVFFGLYGIWLLWHERRAAWRLVAVAFTIVPALWLLPEQVGSGDLLRAMHRAKLPNAGSPAFADDPIRSVFQQFQDMLSSPIWIGLAVLAILALVSGMPGRREGRLAAALLGGGVIWVLEVAYMTNSGFSGNERYLILPAAVACVLGGAGVGWGLRLLRSTPLAGPSLIAVAALTAVLFAQPWFSLVKPVTSGLAYEARVNDGLATAVAHAGGRARILACGVPYAGPFQVPLVAWNLRVHTTAIQDAAHEQLRAPAVVFRTRPSRGSAPGPSLDPLGGEAAVHTLGVGGGWRIVESCT
ncbi:MAG: hypothetical protein QOC78_1133 [Solirubrobacteraceae bacterium]|jgi:hypothetical protein|nr:hypothetical protein [Solirubrobacteraceae bacterium]